MALELMLANTRQIVVRGNRDGRIWKFVIERRGDVRVLVEANGPPRSPKGELLPELDHPAAYRFAYAQASARELIDATEGE